MKLQRAEMEEAFYMIWSPQGYAPTVKHATPISAQTEALRLATTHRGKEFYVLLALERYQTTDVQVTQLYEPIDDEDIPF